MLARRARPNSPDRDRAYYRGGHRQFRPPHKDRGATVSQRLHLDRESSSFANRVRQYKIGDELAAEDGTAFAQGSVTDSRRHQLGGGAKLFGAKAKPSARPRPTRARFQAST